MEHETKEEYVEFGFRLGDRQQVISTGKGYYGKKHAEDEVKRVIHNASLPNVGQPNTAKLVYRTVVKTSKISDWNDG